MCLRNPMNSLLSLLNFRARFRYKTSNDEHAWEKTGNITWGHQNSPETTSTRLCGCVTSLPA
jgi:hypothetical protein